MSSAEGPDGGDLPQTLKETVAECEELYRESGEFLIEHHPDLVPQPHEEFVGTMRDLCRGLAIKVLVEVARSDWNWSAPETAMAVDFFELLWGRRLEPDELRQVFEHTIARADELKWGALVGPFARLSPLADRRATLITVVTRLANLVARADGEINRLESERLQWIVGELDRHLKPIPLADESPSGLPQAPSHQVSATVNQLRREAKGKPQQPPPPPPPPKEDAEARKEQLAAALAELDQMIGLDGVKQEIRQLANFLEIQNRRAEHGLPATQVGLHTLFCGNPGTGKTTVARLYASLLRGLGVLTRGHLVETDRSGLVADYAGQTATKTNRRIDEALDGILFIDEAYSLAAGREDTYGAEALQTLLKRMEDERHRLVVILAGYSQPMERLLASNPGLESRFQRRLEFADFSTEEMCRIFQGMCAKNHYELPARSRARLWFGFDYLVQTRDEHFGNGRVARNLFEQAIRRLANRVSTAAPLTRELLTTLEPCDVQVAEAPAEHWAAIDARPLRWKTTCPGCHQPVRFGTELLGRPSRCRRCNHAFRVEWGEPAPDGAGGKEHRASESGE